MHSAAGVISGVGTTTLPAVSIYSPAGNGVIVRELAVWNTTALSCIYKWQRFTTLGTPGSAVTAIEWDESGVAPTALVRDAHSSTAPTAGGVIEYMPIGAAIGAGYYYTYGASGLVIAPGTANGIGLMLATGTGQLLAYKIVWEEA